MNLEKFKERKSNLERIIVDVSNLTVNHSKTDFSFYFIGGKFNMYFDETPIEKEVIKISRNEWLDLEYIFIKTVEK